MMIQDQNEASATSVASIASVASVASIASVASATSVADTVAETPELVALRDQVRQLEATNASMSKILFVVASGLMFWDPATGIESCRFCSLKRGGEFGYSSKHDETCIVTQARALGF